MKWVATKLLPILFSSLLFFIPLIVFPKTSELFEFNKMVVTYALTVLVVFAWLLKIVYYKKLIFRRTILDIPLILFLFSQIASTITSIDPTTSIFGYYSRLHGGLLSSVSYILLYWAFVSNMDKKAALKSVYYLLFSGVLVSAYAVAQHFGIDRQLWVQDVANRVFSTLGQPNWLAAWVVGVIPLAWALGLRLKNSPKSFLIWSGLSLLLLLTLLYTKSRSGLLGFIAADVIFWAVILRKNVKKALAWHILALAAAFLVGTVWTPSLKNLIKGSPRETISQEPGGTESADIRKIVWKGALEVWRANPIFGTGLETFAYSYYNFRPPEHNLTSEWDFLYNKAHNEYINFAANAGTIGLLTYIILLSSIIILFKRNIKNSRERILNLALLSGFSSILITNFFGFSVVPVAVIFFLFPALSVAISDSLQAIPKPNQKLLFTQLVGIAVLAATSCYFLFLISKYWYADLSYAKGRTLNDLGDPFLAEVYLKRAVMANPLPSVYYDELAASFAGQSLGSFESGNSQISRDLAKTAVRYSRIATDFSPRDVSLKKSQASLFIKLSESDPAYLEEAKNTLFEASLLAPTDAKIHYNLGLTLARLGRNEDAVPVLEKTVNLKPNYRDARFALALLYANENKFQDAREQLIYILRNINTQDPIVQQELEELPVK